MAHRRKPRKGVLLLVVLSLLVLFVLIGTAFIVVASQQHRASIAAGRLNRTGDQPKKTLDAALMQLLRGTRNRNSSIINHDLLGDMYGSDFDVHWRPNRRSPSMRGLIMDVVPIGNQQLYKIRYRDLRFINGDPANPGDRRDDYLSGCVFTVVESATGSVLSAKEQSLRIVSSSRRDPTLPPLDG